MDNNIAAGYIAKDLLLGFKKMEIESWQSSGAKATNKPSLDVDLGFLQEIHAGVLTILKEGSRESSALTG